MQNLNSKSKKDIIERTYIFGLRTIKFCDTFPNKKTFWTISNQLVRSATSVGANIQEAQGCGTRKDFKRFLEISLKSANESIYWLRLSKDTLPDNNIETNNLLKEAHELSLILGKSVITLKN